MQGEEEGTEMEGEHPLGTNTQLETSSSEQESSVEVLVHEELWST